MSQPYKNNNITEFVLLLAFLTALNPLSLDAVLPAFDKISVSLNIADENNLQLIISSMIFGMVFGEFIFGPLSDSFGRKNIIVIGIGIYAFGTALCYLSHSYELLLLGRVIQGLGVSGPKIASRAMIRDSFSGDEMARVMSLVLMFVIFIPMVAPAYGQFLMTIFNWRSIFVSLLVVSLIAGTWLYIRQAETLPVSKRCEFSSATLISSFLDIIRHKQFIYCTAIAGIIFGMQLLFLSTAPLILRDLYSVGDLFALYFAVLAFSLAAAFLLNSKLVMRYGAYKMIKAALVYSVITGLFLLLLTLLNNGIPSLTNFLLLSFLQLFGMGIIFGNINALAMKPMGHVAGFGSSVIASLSSLIAILIAIPIGRFYQDSIMPMAISFFMLPAVGLVLLHFAFKKE